MENQSNLKSGPSTSIDLVDENLNRSFDSKPFQIQLNESASLSSFSSTSSDSSSTSSSTDSSSISSSDEDESNDMREFNFKQNDFQGKDCRVSSNNFSIQVSRTSDEIEKTSTNKLKKKSTRTEFWTDVKIDLNGRTRLPNGIEIVRGVAKMPFIRFETKKSNSFQRRFTNQLSFLHTLVSKEMIKLDCANPFLYPVNSLMQFVPEYYLIIENPMDFDTIIKRLEHYWYRSAKECIEDIRKIFQNCFKFNYENDKNYKSGRKLEAYFDQKLREMPSIEEEIACPFEWPLNYRKFPYYNSIKY